MTSITRKQFLGGTAFASAALLAGCGSTETATDDAASSAPAATDDAASSATDDTAAASGKLIVFAAASMTESLDEVNALYLAAKGVEVSPNYDSSGTLKTQIQEGAECDVFISAGQKQMNQMDAEDTTGSNEEGLDLIESDTRFDILRNEVVLVVPEGNPKEITSFDVLAERLQAGDILMCMGNSDVPVGQYTQKILEYYGLDEETLAGSGVITYGTNVKEVTTQVTEAVVDCGIVYKTDAFSAGLEPVDSATSEMCGEVVYPAAAIKGSANLETAKDYLEFLKTSEASACFEAVGFTPLAEE